MTPLITKEQVKKWNSKLPENIAASEIDASILDAQQYDIISVFPDALLQAIEVQILTRIQQWNRNQTYAVDAAVWLGAPRKFYKAIASNTDSQPPSANWEDFELMNFYEEYLQPLLAYSAFYRFVAYHGLNLTQFGATKPVDPDGTFESISATERASILGDVNSKKNVWDLKCSKKLNAVAYTFDGVVYTVDDGESSRIKIRPKIFQLGGRKDRDCTPFKRCD